MLPDSKYLFSQGELEQELNGRRNRLRQIVKDLEATDLAAGDESLVDWLVEKFDLQDVTIRTGEAEFVPTDGGPHLRIPFTGSGVLLHRSPEGPGAGSGPLPGRVVERSHLIDGERVRSSWVEMTVPADSTPGQLPDEDWQAGVLAELANRVATANERLPRFRLTLRESAGEAVRLRRAKLARTAVSRSQPSQPDSAVVDMS
jgi:hypothetical protein